MSRNRHMARQKLQFFAIAAAALFCLDLALLCPPVAGLTLTKLSVTLVGTNASPISRQTQGTVVGDALYIVGGRCKYGADPNGGPCADPYWAVRAAACGEGCVSATAQPLAFTGSSDVAMRDQAAVATDGQRYIWAHGGVAAGAIASSLDQFDLQTMSISSLAPSPFARTAHCMVYYDNALWGTLGFGTDSFAGGEPATLVRNELWKFDLGSSQWTPRVVPFDWAREPQPREAAACTLFASRLFVYGGRGIAWDAGTSTSTYWYGGGTLGYVDLASPTPQWTSLQALSDVSAYGHPAGRGFPWSWRPDPATWVLYGGTDATSTSSATVTDLRDAWGLRPVCEGAQAPWVNASLAAGPDTVLPAAFGGAAGYLLGARAAILFGGLSTEGGYTAASGEFFAVTGDVPLQCAAIELSNARIDLASGGTVHVG